MAFVDPQLLHMVVSELARFYCSLFPKAVPFYKLLDRTSEIYCKIFCINLAASRLIYWMEYVYAVPETRTMANPGKTDFQSANDFCLVYNSYILIRNNLRKYLYRRSSKYIYNLSCQFIYSLFIHRKLLLTGNCNPCSKTSCACGHGSRVSGPIQPVTISYTITQPRECAKIDTFPCHPGCRLANIKYNLFNSFCKPARTSAP